MTILNDVLPVDDNNNNPPEPEDYLAELVGDDKKYKTPSELAKAKVHADKHIDKLIAEKRELEAKYIASTEHAKTIQDIIKELQGGKTNESNSTPQNAPQTSPEDINKIIETKLQEVNAAKMREVQKETLKAKLTETFNGDFNLASEAIKKYVNGDSDKLIAIDKLLLSDYDDAVELIKKKSGIDKASFTDTTSTKKVTMPSNFGIGLTWSKCEEVRKNDPRRYKSLEFQTAMHKAAQANPNFLKS